MARRGGACPGIVVLVTGGRDFSFPEFINTTLMRIHQEKRIRLLVAGGARGADAAAEKWAKNIGIPQCIHYAKWERYGRLAGPRRNIEMAEHHQDAIVVAFPGGAGTRHMRGIAKKMGMPILELEYPGYGDRK